MEIYTQAFIVKVGYALLTSICPSDPAALASTPCLVSHDWIDDPKITAEGLATCERLADSRHRFAGRGTIYTYECTPYAGGARYGDRSAIETRDGDVDIAEVGAPTDTPDLGMPQLTAAEAEVSRRKYF
jgi:hypothetical protein